MGVVGWYFLLAFLALLIALIILALIYFLCKDKAEGIVQKKDDKDQKGEKNLNQKEEKNPNQRGNIDEKEDAKGIYLVINFI